jgi:hypothetical protein
MFHGHAVKFHYENKTSKCIWKYMNLLHYNSCKPPTRFGRHLWPSSGRCFYEGYVTKTTKPMYKHKIFYIGILAFLSCCISIHWLCCLCNISFVKHLPEDGHKRWPEHVGYLQWL